MALHKQTGRAMTIAVVPKLIHPYFELARKGATDEASRLGSEFDLAIPALPVIPRIRLKSWKTCSQRESGCHRGRSRG